MANEMVVVKIEVWTHGDSTKAREIDRAFIWNDETGTGACGNYEAMLLKHYQHDKPFPLHPVQVNFKDVLRRCSVKNFDREQSAWKLLALVLKACGIDR